MHKVAPFGMAMLFILSQLVGMIVAEPFKEAGFSAFPEPDNPMNIVQIFVVLIVFTMLILLIAKYKEKLVKYVILIAFFLASISIFQAFFYFVNESLASLLALITAIVMLILLIIHPEWYVIDTFGIFLAGGISAIFAISLATKYIILLLVALAVYDFISVYKTKHMVELAKAITSDNLPLLMIFPKKTDFSYMKSEFGKERDAIYMGLGDIIIPGILIIASYMEKGIAGFIATLIGALVGYSILMFQISKGPQPGLPYLNAGVIAGYIIIHFL